LATAQEGHLFYDRACGLEVSPGWVQDILGERPPYMQVKWQKRMRMLMNQW